MSKMKIGADGSMEVTMDPGENMSYTANNSRGSQLARPLAAGWSTIPRWRFELDPHKLWIGVEWDHLDDRAIHRRKWGLRFGAFALTLYVTWVSELKQ